MSRNIAKKRRTQSGMPPTPTGLAMLDEGLGGGMVPGELYGIHSFTGGGATTLSCMVAAEAALAEWKAAYPGPFKRRWCVVATGQSVTDIEAYLFSYLAGIPWDACDRQRNEITAMPADKLSTTVEHAARCGPANERARYARAHAVLQQALLVVDGATSSKTPYWNPTDLLEQAVANAVGPDNDLAGLVVDGIGFFVEHYLSTSGQPEQAESRLYRKILSGIRAIFGEQHRCPMWITHRLRGALAQSPPDATLTHHDVGGSKHLGDELDACFVLGNQDVKGRFFLRCTKTPCASEPESCVVRFDPGGIRAIVEDTTAGVQTSSAQGWRADCPINIDDQTLVEMQRLAAEMEQQQSWYHRREPRTILVRADD